MILVPVDFSPASLRALQVALELAPQLGAEVVLLQVFPHPAPPAQELPAELVHRYYDEAEAAQRWPLEQLGRAYGGLQRKCRHGDPATKIVDAIDELRPTMVMMGTHGRQGLKRMIFGSVAEEVVRRSSVPVLTVHPA
jgi:nucleotide-binding universal stress UspA family protein